MKWPVVPAVVASILISQCLFTSSSLAATTLLHSETVSGDLGEEGAAPFLSAALGQNVVIGTISRTSTPAFLDIDAFSFVVGAGQTAGNFSFAFTNTSLISPSQLEGQVLFYAGTFGSSGLIRIGPTFTFLARAPGSPFGSSSHSPLELTLGAPLGAGQYSISMEPTQIGTNGGAVPYVLTFDVAAIPEPSAYAMILAGLGLLGFAVRRKKRQAA